MSPPTAMKTYLRENDIFWLKVLYPNNESRGRDIGEYVKKKKANSLTVSDLPADLLGEILSWLHSDRVRFGATCKKNYSLITTTIHDDAAGGDVSDHNHQSRRRAFDRLPWLATFSPSRFEPTLRLYDPFHRPEQPPYAVYGINCSNEEGLTHPSCNRVITSKNGWLLFLWPEKPNFTSFLLFSPFNGSFIKLPDLSSAVEQICMATFSTDPSSRNCVYFVLTHNVVLRKIGISTLQNRNRRNARWEWKTSLFDDLRMRSVDSVAYHDGCFYCVSGGSEGGNLASYDPVRVEWTVIISKHSWQPLVDKDPNLSRKHYILECDGNLLLVCLDTELFNWKMKNTTNETTDRCSLFEFNRSRMSWVQKTSLGDHAIFIGYDYGTSFAVSTRWSSDIANKIYFYCINSKYPKYYSLEDGKSYHCTGSTTSCWSSAIPGGIWIQPRSTESP